jgi:uncharacterized protein (TIGR01777 family)
MRIVMAGGSGFLGTAWRDRLAREGHDVVRLVRGEAMSAQESSWDPHRGEVDPAVIDGADVVVCISGSALAGNPHSAKYRSTLRDSRVNPTSTLAKAIAASDRKPALIAQNGTSFYGDRGDEELKEDSGTAPGSLLTEVTREWQAVTEPAAESGARVCVLRTAPVMHPKALAFRLIRTVFWTGLAGPLGDGRQYFPLISLEDWLGAATFLLSRDESSGPYNLSIPDPCTNAEFTEALGRALHRPTKLRVPAAPLRKAAGRLSGELLGSARIIPAKLLDEGFTFQHPDVEAVLAYALGR